MTNSTITPNKLINETSPYLLQHAYNPVDWFPWGEEAFVKAKAEDKPIFLSIGYSTCHWCHVMERESFEDYNVAKTLNENFISIKVDREERPDIDSIYMDACQIMTGSGGWPLSLFLDHDRNCFFAGTYFPKNSFMDLLERIHAAFETNRQELSKHSQMITKHLNNKPTSGAVSSDLNLCQAVYESLHQNFDSQYGGFSFAPKFPSPQNLLFLIEYGQATLPMAEKTLQAIYDGGIHDHVGGGYCRYSTDNKWLVPHFEKMLYDNALLAISFARCYEKTKNPLYEKGAIDILEYVLRDMTDENGGFYSAEDADSEGIEGLFYVWTKEEIENVLGEDAKQFCVTYHITDEGNFEGRNIPNLINSEYLELDSCLNKLFLERKKRKHPFKDTKILVGWNGLMIAAFAICGRLFNNQTFIQAAEKALQFILTNVVDADKHLLSIYKEGTTKNRAHLEDIAFLAWGSLELYKSTFRTSWLLEVIHLCNTSLDEFYDKELGGFFLTGNSHEQLIARAKPLYDGAYPSPNAVMLDVLTRMALLTGNPKYEDAVNATKNCIYKKAILAPEAFSYFCLPEIFSKTSPIKIILIGCGEALNDMLKICKENLSFCCEVAVIYTDNDIEQEQLFEALGIYHMIGDQTTAFVCKDKTCFAPITETNDFERLFIKP